MLTQQNAGKIDIETLDLSGAAFSRVAFLVLKHFIRHEKVNVKILILKNTKLTLSQCADLLDTLQVETSLQTLDVPDSSMQNLPLRSLAELITHSKSLRTLVCNGIYFVGDEARHFMRGLLKNEHLERLFLARTAPQGLGNVPAETELLFRS